MTVVLMALLSLQSTLVVSPSSPWRHVADAVAAARPGDTVLVRPGTYTEPAVLIDKSLVLLGEPGAVLDGEGQHGLLVVAAANVTVQGLGFRNTGASFIEDRAALLVREVGDCTISDNHFDDTFFAIYLQKAHGCLVTGNTITARPGREVTTGNGIHSWGSEYLTVRGNTVRGHRDGIYFEFTRHATVTANRSEANSRYGLHFMFSDSSTYADNSFTANGTGVAVMYSGHINMTGNTFNRNRGMSSYGLLLKDVTDVQLNRNTFANNTTALVADGANRLMATTNEFRDNAWAIRLLASTDAANFEDNAFKRNTFDVAVNSRRTSAATFSDNWWDSYRGWDLDRDGIGDVPHHPVRLFSLLVARAEPALLLQRSLFVRLLDATERAMPMLTPDAVVDSTPRMRPPASVGAK